MKYLTISQKITRLLREAYMKGKVLNQKDFDFLIKRALDPDYLVQVKHAVQTD